MRLCHHPVWWQPASTYVAGRRSATYGLTRLAWARAGRAPRGRWLPPANDPRPPQHVIVYDEAHRAWDAEQVAAKHALPFSVSEPEAFVGFGERIPEWCVLVGLIGSGQEVHMGAEAGLLQRFAPLAQAGSPEQWTVHAPRRVLDEFFADSSLPAGIAASETLDLTVELRFHFAADLDEWVDGLLTGGTDARGRELAARLETAGYHLRMTRDLDEAKDYFGARYAEAPDARYGLVASSRDTILQEWGVPDAPRPLVRRRRGEPSLLPPPARVRHRVRRSGAGARRRAARLGDRPGLGGGRRRRRRFRGLVQRPRQAPCALGARARPLPAARQRLSRAAHPRPRRGGHLRPAPPRARRHRRPAAGAWRESALTVRCATGGRAPLVRTERQVAPRVLLDVPLSKG